MIQRTVLEWSPLPYGPDDADPATIPQWAADRIAAVAAASPLAGRGGTGVLEHGRKALRARAVVGVIAARGCALEILPKIDVQGCGETANAAIRKRLIHMLAVAHDMRIEVGSMTDLDWQSDTILEILIRVFADKLADAVRQGMPRHYIAHQDDLRALRGSLDVVRQFTRHAANPSRLACRFDELSPDIALNQIMKATLARLARVARSLRSRRRLQDLSLAYAEISSVPVARLAWDRARLDRTNHRWGELLGLARLLLADRFQTTTGGDGTGFALLFDMNDLFEKYIGRLVLRALAGSDLRGKLQGGLRYCLTDEETGRQTFQTRPDIVIRRGDRVVHVIDTKWKRISPRLEDAKRGVSQADVYQMMAYGQIYDVARLTLLYPHHTRLPGGEGVQARNRVAAGDVWLETTSFDVADGRSPVERLRRLVLG